MANLSVKKVNAIPVTLQSNCLYLVKSDELSLLDIYLSNSDATDVRHIISKAEITSLINTSMSARPIFSLAKMPNAADVAIGSVINIPKSEFSNNTGISDCGIYLKSDGYNWVTAYEGQVFSAQFGTAAVPLVSAFNPWAVNSDLLLQIFPGVPGGNPKIPWQLMHLGMRIEVEATYGFNTATATAVFNNLFGKVNSAVNPAMGKLTVAYSTGRQVTVRSRAVVTSGVSYSCQTLPDNAIYASANANEGNVADRGSSLDWTSAGDTYINFAVDPGAAESLTTTLAYDLHNYTVRLLA